MLQYSRLPTGIILYEGEQGWRTSASLEQLVLLNGTATYGATAHMTVVRADSIKFFSMFIVILMWVISLGMLVLAINYMLSSSLEVFYDIPALAIALLFALPFVRDVQPSVPTVGITVDILGFFFNMIIIAIATLMVMGALSSRHHRAKKLLVEAAQPRSLNQAAQQSVGEGNAPAAKLDDEVA
eukprot:365303-Chlamydomonas_euryale.AAC.56